MKLFECQNCGALVHFTNTACVTCGYRLGFVAESCSISAVVQKDNRWTTLAQPSGTYFFCDNAADGVCNWLIEDGSPYSFCRACRHNRTIPDLTIPVNWTNWAKLEAAKRQLFYSLLRWNLPMPDREDDAANGLVFDFLADTVASDGTLEKNLTGHDNGVVVMNIAEADDAERERRRGMMHEPYRTLLGHFRHEVGHYYWDRLVRDGGRLEEFRALFGDESVDYAAALHQHYQNGAPGDWPTRFISSYASSHPWEDFAECWAHYTHIVDALETARAFGVAIDSPAPAASKLSMRLDFDPYRSGETIDLVGALVPLTVAINSVNRSMGQPDFYPFVLSQPVIEKLAFIQGLIRPFGEPARAKSARAGQ